MRMRRIWLSTGALILSVVMTGCFQGEQSLEEMDPPEDAAAVDGKGDKEADGEAADNETAEDEDGIDAAGEGDTANESAANTVDRQLFLLDKNGMVAPQILQLPEREDKEVAAQALEYLVKGGPVTSLLPNGFQAVLPEGTEVLGLN